MARMFVIVMTLALAASGPTTSGARAQEMPPHIVPWQDPVGPESGPESGAANDPEAESAVGTDPGPDDAMEDNATEADAPAADVTPPSFDAQRLARLPVLRIGLVLDPSAEAFRVAEPFRAALERGLRVPVHLIAYSDLARVKSALLRGEIDYAPLSATAYADAWRDCACVVPVVAPRSQDGSAGWHAVALVRADSPFEDLADLKGARLATGGPWSTAGTRLPLAALTELGFDPETHFAERIAHEGSLAAARAVLAGRADVAFGWSSLRGDPATGYTRGTLRRLAEAEEPGAAALRIVWTSAQVPHGPHVVRREIPEDIRRAITELLVFEADLEADDGLKSVSPHGFLPVTHADFAPVLAIGSRQDETAPGRLRPLGGGGR